MNWIVKTFYKYGKINSPEMLWANHFSHLFRCIRSQFDLRPYFCVSIFFLFGMRSCVGVCVYYFVPSRLCGAVRMCGVVCRYVLQCCFCTLLYLLLSGLMHLYTYIYIRTHIYCMHIIYKCRYIYYYFFIDCDLYFAAWMSTRLDLSFRRWILNKIGAQSKIWTLFSFCWCCPLALIIYN